MSCWLPATLRWPRCSGRSGMRVTSVGSPALAELARAGSPGAGTAGRRSPGRRAAAGIPERHPAPAPPHGHARGPVHAGRGPGPRSDACRASASAWRTRSSSAELRAAIGRIQAARPAAKKGEVYAFIGAKGGVGATTVAVNVAATLAKAAPGGTHAGGPAHDLRRRRGVPGRRAAVLHRRRVREHAPAGRRRAEGAGDRLAVGRPAAGLVRAARRDDTGRGADARR